MSTPSSTAVRPLSRFLQLSDLEQLGPELALVDDRFQDAAAQHPMRRWEYALALHAIRSWYQTIPHYGPIVDVGGAGSPFYFMAKDVLGVWPTVVDPAHGALRQDLQKHLAGCPRLAKVVTCLSVIEHVKDEAQFLYHLSCLLAPGGLLVLTFDAVDATDEQDTYHFHWMRERIYTPTRIGLLLQTLGQYRIFPETPPDFTQFAPHVHDYSFFSLVCRKDF